MNVLLTGAFGNLGCIVLEKLIEQGHQVTAFDVKNKLNEQVAKSIKGNFNLVWGDIRDKDIVKKINKVNKENRINKITRKTKDNKDDL